MLPLQEVLQDIQVALLKRDLMHERTTANSVLMHERCDGKFEAVMTGKDDEKCLIPDVGTLVFLYRGQNEEVIPVEPTIYRKIKQEDGDYALPSEIDIFVERLRFIEFRKLLQDSPIIKGFFKRHNFIVDYEGLAQHYGLKTSVLDLTSSLDVALFFATNQYDSVEDTFKSYDDGKTHHAVLYVFDPSFDNEPIPVFEEEYLNHNIRPIGLQAFPRPGRQFGFSLHLERGHQLKCYKYEFSFTCEESKFYHDKCMNEFHVWDKDDILIEKAKLIAKKTVFGYDVFKEAYREYRPAKYTGKRLRKSLADHGIVVGDFASTLFEKSEKEYIRTNWNTKVGPKLSEIIVRKRWFETDDATPSNSDEVSVNIKKDYEFATLKRLGITQMLLVLSAPNCLSKATWVNYTNKPSERVYNKQSHGWQKVPASFLSIWGKPYLTKNDYLI